MTKDPNKIQTIVIDYLRIVCAANKHKVNGRLILGARHWDKIMHDQFKELKVLMKGQDFIQGFIDNRGDFHTREEAFIIATKQNQIIKKTGGENSIQLFSEDLY
tara:strand:+ start:84 stop:395 length:312 start_codon:yes stop_codon:yes gene_type:complete